MFQDNDNNATDTNQDEDGQNTMAVLSTLGGSGGGDDVLPEGEPMGLDPEAGKAKVSGSSLAVGVVVVLGAATLLGMKLTLGAIAGGGSDEAHAAIDNFMIQIESAKPGDDGPIKAPTQESKQVLDELKQNPTDHQVPAEEVASNPFDISAIVHKEVETDNPIAPKPDEREHAIEIAKAAASRLKVDAISGEMVFINGEQYRIGTEIGNSGFVLESVDGLTCIIRTTDRYKIPIRLRYR